MTPDREKNMRTNLAELGHEELCDTCVQMQTVIDGHVSEKSGFNSSISQMQRQIPALQNRVKELEDAADGSSTINGVEFDQLKEENARLRTRLGDLQDLNEGLTKKLLT